MSRIGDFLEVIHGPKLPFQTVAAVIHHYRTAEVASQPDSTFQIFLKPPAEARIEENRKSGRRAGEYVTVVDELQWRRRSSDGNESSGTSDEIRKCPWLTDVNRHFDTNFLRDCFALMTLEFVGETTFLNVACARIHAVPTRRNLLWPHWLPYPAEEYEFWADPFRGVLLAIRAYQSGLVVAINEVVQVTYDQPMG